MSLSTACRIPAGAITADDHSVAMPADVSVLSVSLRDVGGSGERSFTARLRVTLRDSVAPAPVRRRLFDTDVSGFAARVSPPSSTTPRLIPLPTYDGWTLRAVRVAGCARRADDIAAFFSGIFAET